MAERRSPRNMARGGPTRPWHAARAHRRPGDARATEGARNAWQGTGGRPVRRVRVRHRTLAPHDRGAVRRPPQRNAVHAPSRLEYDNSGEYAEFSKISYAGP